MIGLIALVELGIDHIFFVCNEMEPSHFRTDTLPFTISPLSLVQSSGEQEELSFVILPESGLF